MNDQDSLKIKNYTKFEKSIIYGFAGLIGNLSSGLFYPLELVRIRLQGNII
jgi:hypothetical protein